MSLRFLKTNTFRRISVENRRKIVSTRRKRANSIGRKFVGNYATHSGKVSSNGFCLSRRSLRQSGVELSSIDHGFDENVYEKRASEQQQFIDVLPPPASGCGADGRRHDLDTRNAREDGEENRSIDESESQRKVFFIIRN